MKMLHPCPSVDDLVTLDLDAEELVEEQHCHHHEEDHCQGHLGDWQIGETSLVASLGSVGHSPSSSHQLRSLLSEILG